MLLLSNMELDDDLFRRTGAGCAQHMNLMDASQEEVESEFEVHVPRAMKTPVITVANFPTQSTLRNDIFHDPEAANWNLGVKIELGLQASTSLAQNRNFWSSVWTTVEGTLGAYKSRAKEFRNFVYELQARAVAYDQDLAHCGLVSEAKRQRHDVEPDGFRLSHKNLVLQLWDRRLTYSSNNVARLAAVRAEELAAGNQDTYKLYLDIKAKVLAGEQVKICVEGEAGSGKTYLLNALTAALRLTNDKRVLAVSVTRGGLDTLLGGELLVERFRVTKYALNDLDSQAMDLTPTELRALAAVDLIIIDGCQRLPAQHFVLMDKLFQSVMNNEDFMGGKSVLMAADWAQPVDEARPSMRFLARNQRFIDQVSKVTLEGNKRFDDSCSGNWKRFINNVASRHGYVDDIPLEVKQIPYKLGPDEKNCGLSDLINFVYNNIEWQIGQNGEGNPAYFYSRVILTRQATMAELINNFIVKQLPAPWFMQVALALDSRPRMQRSGRLLGPPFQLKLSPGMPLMLTQDINPARGLCQGTLVYFDSLSTTTMRVKRRLVEDGGWEQVTLAKTITKMRSTEGWDGFPSRVFERVQFPVRPAFAQVLTKAEGKTYERVGLLWSKEPTRVLHGELYLAVSRVRHPKNLAICVPWHMEDLFKTPDDFDNCSLLMDSLTEKPGLLNTVFNF